MIISIGGTAGSGKSTIGKLLAEKLGWPRYYIGGLRRQKARERGMTLAEYNKLGETDPSTDFEVDEYQKELAQKEDSFIIEGRTSWFFIPESIKIFVTVSEEEGARRVLKELQESDRRNEDSELQTLEDVILSHRKRIESDNKRYQKYYHISVYDPANYDFVVDTTDLSREEAFARVLSYIQERLR